MTTKTKIKWICLKDNPQIIDKIKLIENRIKDVIENDTDRHLADVGCSLRFISNDFKDLSDEVFELHNQQKMID